MNSYNKLSMKSHRLWTGLVNEIHLLGDLTSADLGQGVQLC